MKILITGSSGYIGSVLCKISRELGHTVIGWDREPPRHNYCDHNYQALISDPSIIESLKQNNNFDIDAVFHLAASIDVTESGADPALYYRNNVGETAYFLDHLVRADWRGKMIFSSTAAVYKNSDQPLDEALDNIGPGTTYGKSKLFCETILEDLSRVYDIPVVIFRYFNVAGAYNGLGDHHTSNHVIPKICNSLIQGIDFSIYGTDLNTTDGSCIRDYVHVFDVCMAHFHVLDWMSKPVVNHFNLGTGHGTSVRQIADAVKAITKKPLTILHKSHRSGDPTHLVADGNRFTSTTGFQYTHSNLDTIIRDSWDFYSDTNRLTN